MDTVPFDEINRATLYITGDGRARLIPEIFTIIPKIPFISGVRCIEDSELKTTSWLYIGWKLALLDGIPVGMNNIYEFMTVQLTWIEIQKLIMPLIWRPLTVYGAESKP